MILQDILRMGLSPESLAETYAIKVKAHKDYPQLLQFKYDQINSPMAEPLVQECRGVILDSSDNWNCVARSFDKFFNFGEPNAATIDWNTAEIQEKLDGSLIIMYFYEGQWHVATSGTPDASGPVNGAPMTFRELFWETFEDNAFRVSWFNRGLTYSFELMTKWNRIVVNHTQPRLKLIGIRNPYDGLEQRLPDIPDLCVRTFSVDRTPEAVLASMELFSGKDQEGYVVCDANFNRVKIKHPEYLKYHRFIDGMSEKRILEIVIHNEDAEVLAYFPEWKQELDAMHRRYDRLILGAMSAYTNIEQIEDQKAFALEALKTPYHAAMFAVRAKKHQGFRDYYADVKIEYLMDLLNRITPDA